MAKLYFQYIGYRTSGYEGEWEVQDLFPMGIFLVCPEDYFPSVPDCIKALKEDGFIKNTAKFSQFTSQYPYANMIVLEEKKTGRPLGNFSIIPEIDYISKVEKRNNNVTIYKVKGGKHDSSPNN